MEALNCLKPQCHIYLVMTSLQVLPWDYTCREFYRWLIWTQTCSKWRCCLTFATRRNHEFKSKMFTAISVLISHSTFLVWASSQVQKLLIEKIVSSQEKWPHNTAASISYDDYFSLAPKLIYSHLFHQVYYLDRQTLGHFKNVDASELILTTRDLKHQSHIFLE